MLCLILILGNELVKLGYNSFDWNDCDRSQSILVTHYAMTNDRISIMNYVIN
jgi:hypothetical protein